MGPKNSLLATLGALAMGTTILAPSTAEAKYHEQCEVIRKLTNVDELLRVVRRPGDPCAAVALQRIIDLSDVAAGPSGHNQIADAS
jgi:hypothetical protein